MDEQYSIRFGGKELRSIFNQKIKPNNLSRPSSRSSKGILYPNLEYIDKNNEVNVNIQDNTIEKG